MIEPPAGAPPYDPSDGAGSSLISYSTGQVMLV